jgi:hypothetical protein
VVNEFAVDLKGIQKLLYEETAVRNVGIGIVRSKRGLIDVLGYGIKYLFGTADARDVKRLTTVCDELHVFKAKITHAAEQQVTYIRTLDETIKQNANDIADLARALRDFIHGLSVKTNTIEADVLDTQIIIEKQARYSAATREIEMAMLEMKFNVVQLQETLDVTSNGKLSSVLINPV